MKKIFLIMGETSAGKDYLTKRVSKELNIPIALSFTTRNKRSCETNGVEYEFISYMNFASKLRDDEIAEYTVYRVNDYATCYGLSRAEIEKDDYVLAIVNNDGERQIREVYGDKVVSILIDAEDRTRMQRALNREKNPSVLSICRRFLVDAEDFNNIVVDYIVHNDFDGGIFGDVALDNLIGIIKGEMTTGGE